MYWNTTEPLTQNKEYHQHDQGSVTLMANVMFLVMDNGILLEIILQLNLKRLRCNCCNNYIEH